MRYRILMLIAALAVTACVVDEPKKSEAHEGCKIDSTAFEIFQETGGTFLTSCRLLLRDGTEDTVYVRTEYPSTCPDTTMWKGISYPVMVGAHGPQCLLDHAD